MRFVFLYRKSTDPNDQPSPADMQAGYMKWKSWMDKYAKQILEQPPARTGPKPGGADVSVGELATLGVQALGGRPWRHEPDPTSLEAKSLAIDASLARRVLGFESRLDAPQAVALTMDWYRRQAAGEDAFALCLEQIESHV